MHVRRLSICNFIFYEERSLHIIYLADDIRNALLQFFAREKKNIADSFL